MPTYNQVIRYLVVFLIDVAGLTLMITVLFSSLSTILKRIFVLMTLLMFAWVDFAFLARVSGNTESGLFLIKLAWSITPLLFVLIYSFIVNYLKIYEKYKILTINLYLVGVIFTFVVSFTPYVIKDILFKNGVLNIIYGNFVWAFFGFISILTVLNFFILIKRFKEPKISNDLRFRLKFLITGLTILFIANALFNIFFPVFLHVFNLYEFGDYSTIVFFALITYATVQHEFLGVKIIGATFLSIFLGSFILLDNILYSQNIVQQITKGIVFILYLPFGYLLVRSVMSEVKQKERLEELNQRLKDLDKQKDEFVSMAAHELRAPMTAIKGYISMVIEGDAGDIPNKARGFLADANVINERLVRLVNNMLNVSRIEEGRMVYQLEPENLSHYVRTACNQFAPEAGRKGLKYSLEIVPEVRDQVYVDGDRIQEVMANLISNAIKYTDQGSVTVKLIQPTAGSIRFEVKDTGLGISDEEQKKLFQKFYRVETNAGKTTGTGLGLYISKLLIDKFGGKIGLDSEPGKGSTFWFELPLAASNYRVAEETQT